MARVYVGGLTAEIAERELEDEFSRYGVIQSIWVARKPPGFAFVEFEDSRDAEDAVRKGDGVRGWRVELSRRPPSGRRDTRDSRRDDHNRGAPRPGRGEIKCYECHEVGHLARDCRNKGRGRSPPRRRDYSPRRRDYSPRRRERSPRRRDDTPPRRRDDSPRRRDGTLSRRRDETPPRHRDEAESPREPRDSPGHRRDSPPAEDIRHDDGGSPPRDRSRSPAGNANGNYREANGSPGRDRSPADRSRSRSR